MANVQILFGYSPNIDYLNKSKIIENLEEKLKHEIEFEMNTGRQGMLPSFIGELIITNINNEYQMTLLKSAYNF